ncbi:carboxypeptidase-like regulatory domain-containing protein [Cesiribacter sp. SM1]|uniref:carboxypeptidase-like regulatory domain-containing protein n=1 Tax=Cesiribacter sp. SM1 TaxID=2861196 RepID=UPI001CD793FF|nr:carboxypeptidase-like regulatory domain-containing protein [Cesiribacter sp. SM1]
MKSISITSILRKCLICLYVLAFFTALNGCTDDDGDVAGPVVVEDPLSPAPSVTTTLSGLVLDEEGNPLSGVRVTAHGETATTDAEGSFRLQDVQVPGNRCVISAGKEGYFTSVRAEVPRKEKETRVNVYLQRATTTHTIDAMAGGTATLANGSKVEIPTSGLVTESGDVYEGEVNMSVLYQDPSAAGFGAVVAGGDMMARRTDESSTILYSYGILRVLLTGSDGEKLQLAAGKPSTLTVAIPESQLTTAPQTIPLWYFDEEEGVWQEEGSATRQGDKYIGTVKHFTDWNCDDPKEFATIIGRVVDCRGEALNQGDIYVGQSTNDLSNGIEIDNDGPGAEQIGFEKRVPAGMPLMVMVAPPLTIPPLTTPNEKFRWVLVPVPPLAPGQVYDVGTIKPDPCPSIASGKFKTKQGDKVKYLSMKVVNGGGHLSLIKYAFPVKVADADASFTANYLAANATYTLQVITESGLNVTKTFSTAAAGETVDLGIIDLSGPELVAVAGIVHCHNAPIANATVEAAWAGGSASTTTDASGTYEVLVPATTAGTITITHEDKTGTTGFQAPASGGASAGPLNMCETTTETGVNSFVIDGDGYANTTKVISLSPYPNSFIYYNRDAAVSTLTIHDVSGNQEVAITFLGNALGEAEKSGTTGARITLKTGNNSVHYFAGLSMEGTDLDVRVTRYDAVGGLVEGTFSGTFMSQSGNPVTIKEGKFSVIRFNDLSGACGGFCM